MMFGLMAISCNLVPWFFGNGYDKVIPNMMIIALILVFIAMSSITGTQYLLPTGRQRQYTISIVAGCVINCCLNFLFIPMFLSLGAAVATIVAELSVTAIQVYFTRKDFDFKNIVLSNGKYVICSAIMFVPTYWLARTLTPTILHTMICVTVGGIVYFGMLLFVKDETLMEVIGKIKIRMRGNTINKE